VLLSINSAYATTSTVAERGSAMEHLRNYRAAAGRKLYNGKTHQKILGHARRLIFAVAALLVAALWGSTSHAQSGPFAGMAGVWSGGGVFQVVATAPGFTANITLTTRGTKQSVVIRSESVFRGASISLSRT